MDFINAGSSREQIQRQTSLFEQRLNDLSDDRDVVVEMTLTAPGCPVAGEMPIWVEEAVKKVEGVKSARAELTFDPPWDPSKMSDEAKLALNMF